MAVGDSYGGGTVFCVSQTPDASQCVTEGYGDHSLIIANEDQANYDSTNHGVIWSTQYYKTMAQSYDDGAANTAAIITKHPDDNSTNNAAWACHNYRDQEKHTDWYLPSRNELNKMYIYAKANNLIGRNCTGKKEVGVQCLVGGHSDKSMYYWSSTEDRVNYYGDALIQRFSDGDQSADFKVIGHLGARAISRF